MSSTNAGTAASDTPIYDELVTEHEDQLPLIHLGRALSGELVTVARATGLDPRIVPSDDVPVLPRRRAS
ncbi:hypothetical protein [Cellulosimicrobium sp. CUA-896]|uniref:hypothetical protein n=1 Tax=Cellulosimicrobium sp. CUA-896 TaxID=1517881 RepID=UPI00095FACDA|nr:hypothetical protein [Cellulosimicrobium sp. CUA-896]OLT49032.1 hypothetical protein BJF88_16405 [Cellulosimicrobium sp. CUA-896]